MYFSLVTLTTLLFLKGTQLVLLEPVRQCVPTAVVRGPCNICVCSSEGVFHCHPHECISDAIGRNKRTEDCGPNFVYRQDNMFCTCNSNGFWISDNCEKTFHYLQPLISTNYEKLRTNVTCNPNTLYLIDCNICRCAPGGFIDINLCTNRYCAQGHKADSCTYGDILRLSDEICSCSDINYYIDRLCIKIENQVVQTLNNDEIVQLVDIGRSWRRLRDLQTDICDMNVMYTVDCNKCMCIESHLACTTKICKPTKNPLILKSLRFELPNEIESLPELKNASESCDAGKRYRFNCNTCLCTADGIPSCTTMVCLNDFVLDIQSLRGVLSNG